MKPRDLIAHVARAFDVRVADLTGRSRMSAIVEARQVACWVLRRACPALALADIGRLLHRDHTTVIYSLKQVEQRLDIDPVYAAQLHSLLPQHPHRRPDHAMRWWVAQSRESFFVRAA
ncbi:MAG: hypothetical protein M3R61_00010 [Chloroflexota bacterium]|nr:hypothetical protein [Chloroflexota bacterium]